MNLVKLFEPFQIFKQLPDFTKYTHKGADNKNHFGEHYCCLIQADERGVPWCTPAHFQYTQAP
jgi:hypothetical protein